MDLSKEKIQKFKELLEKKTGKEVSWGEAEEGANNLANFAKFIYDQAVIDKKRQIRLEKEPKGFNLEGKGYTCAICRRSISDEETWYDKWGIKCLICQEAINKRIIPGSVAKNDNSWYSEYDLNDRFSINRHAMKQAVKEGVLKPRIVPSDLGKPYVYIFLIKDNKDTLPPKKLTEPQLVKEIKEDGKEWFHLEPWHRFVDPFKHLEGYKIINYIQVVEQNEAHIK